MTKSPQIDETSAPSAPKAKVAQPPPMEPTKREKLLEAKARGANDAAAAEYAGMSQTEFDEEVATDPTLEADMLSARAGALLKHLKSIEDASQWQAHVYALEKLWPVEFAADTPARGGKPKGCEDIRVVVGEMRTEQLPQTASLLRDGVHHDNAKNPAPLQLPCISTQTSSTSR